MRLTDFAFLWLGRLTACILLILGLTYILPGFAADGSTSLDTNAVLLALLPELAWLIYGILGIVALWLAKLLKDKWHIDISAQLAAIEAAHRDALHSAVQTGLGAALHQLGPAPIITTSSPAGQMIINTVKASVPEAVQVLGATDDWIVKAAQAHLQLGNAGVLLPPPADAIQIAPGAPAPMPATDRPAAAS